MAQEAVDELFGYLKEAWKKDNHLCCDMAEEAVFDCIMNSTDENPESLALSKSYQSPRVSIHQHLERHHLTMFLHKLRMDLMIALLLDDLVLRCGPEVQYALLNTGGRVLMSEPGCSAQSAHNDFKIRYSPDGTAVPNCSLFVMWTGRDAASVVVCTGFHVACARFQMLLDEAERDVRVDGGDHDTIAGLNEVLCGRPPSARVVIPPYFAFVARGDVVHAGDAHSGPDIGLRYHVHCRSNHDEVLNTCSRNPSSTSSAFSLRPLMTLNIAFLCYTQLHLVLSMIRLQHIT
jgi:hypothetical protein